MHWSVRDGDWPVRGTVFKTPPGNRRRSSSLGATYDHIEFLRYACSCHHTLPRDNAGVSSFLQPFNIYERIQLAVFSAQEIIISGLYIWETMTSLRPVLTMKGRAGNRVILNLIFINTFVVLLDASLLATQYSNNFDVQTTYKTVVYSVKMKMEFTVLNSLLNVIRADPSVIEGPQQQGLVPHPLELTLTDGRSADVPAPHIHAKSFSPNPQHGRGRIGVAKQEMRPGPPAESFSTRIEVRQPVLRHEDV